MAKAASLPTIDIGIPEAERRKIAEGLSRLLADTFTLYLTTHNFHWNVKGPMFQTLHHQAGIAQALNTIGEIARFGGDDARARQAYDACLAMSDESRETRLTRHACGNLAFLAQHAGEYERARALAVHGVRIALAMDIELDIADSLATLAGVIAATGQVEQAARLLGTWDAALVRMGVQPDLPDRAEHERTIALARARLDAASFEAAWAVGRAMSRR